MYFFEYISGFVIDNRILSYYRLFAEQYMAEYEDELDALRAKAIHEKLAFGVTRLREEYRMKPSADAKPHAYIKSPYNKQKNAIFLVGDCVPLRKVNKKAPTQKQLNARKRASLKFQLQSRLHTESIRLKSWLDQYHQQIVVLDTETTGLSSTDQIIELGIIDMSGTILFENRFKPTVEISLGAKQVHGITASMLESAPLFYEKINEIKRILHNKHVVIFNAPFDIGMLYSTCHAFDICTTWINKLHSVCAMNISVDAFGASNRHGSISLADAASEAQVKWQGSAHSAIIDCQTTREILLSIANASAELLKELHDSGMK